MPVCAVGVEGVFEIVAVALEHERQGGQRRRQFLERLLQMQRQRALAELLHQRGLLLHDDEAGPC